VARGGWLGGRVVLAVLRRWRHLPKWWLYDVGDLIWLICVTRRVVQPCVSLVQFNSIVIPVSFRKLRKKPGEILKGIRIV